MIIKNALIGGKIKNIVIENGVIADITENDVSGDCVDAEGCRVIPGLIDVHTHGMMGYDTMDADFEPLCEAYAKCGTTSFLPTTMTMGYDALIGVVNAKTDFPGANVLGFHFEGPYISPKYKGAQDENNIRIPDVAEFRRFKNVKMITVAPEIENGLSFIKQVSAETVVSIGHTDCDYRTAITAIENGASCLTHTFNAMPPMLHRAPGPIGAAVEKNIYAQIICDGLHVHKAAFLAAYRMFGADRLCLISDSIRPAKLPDGEYESGGLPVVVKDNEIRLKNGGNLAGSCACLLDCVKKAIEFGIPENDAVKMATETPANLLGVKKGSIQRGYDADLIILDPDFSVKNIIIGGQLFE
ncbi:MAG: N-acetylglucosamine-6-phosphate deacetylase [Clostridia bacterium]|nr:N-acetylglucosamine-6-phosphate deacetylase [Clostridia bacterium]